jgi:hypothetical protein
MEGDFNLGVEYIKEMIAESIRGIEGLKSFDDAKTQNARLMVLSNTISGMPIVEDRDCSRKIYSMIKELNKIGTKVARRLRVNYIPFLASVEKESDSGRIMMKVLKQQEAEFET